MQTKTAVVKVIIEPLSLPAITTSRNMRYLIEFLTLVVVVTVYGADPEIHMDAIEMIYRWGYEGQTAVAETEDGYILTMHRIPYGKAGPTNTTRPVVFLQHGLEGSSTSWISNLPNESLAFILADQGFDVWMGNCRGNIYSMRHVSLTPKDHKFWEFTWDEMAKYDLTAMIDKALQETGQQQVYYVGHSQGTLIGFAEFSSDLEFAKKINKYFALAPIATVGHLKVGMLQFLAKFTDQIEFLLSIIGMDKFTPNKELMQVVATYVCGNKVMNKLLCEDIMFLITGPEGHQFNDSRVPVYVAHSSAGTSSADIVHFGQMVKSDKFQMYDCGRKCNLNKYGQETPPLYDLKKMQVPTYLFWGLLDALADKTDIETNLIPNLQNMKGNFMFDDYNHEDFTYGMKAPREIYWKIIDIIRTE